MKLTEVYQKLISGGKIIKAQNSIEMVENLKKNDIIKVLSKYKGTEKLIQLLKEGYNETVRELIFEISSLKNYILEINKELVRFIESKEGKGVNLQENFLEMPFLDTIYKIKNILGTNLSIVFNNTSEINIDIFKENKHLKPEEEDEFFDDKNLGISHISKKESLFEENEGVIDMPKKEEKNNNKIEENDDYNVDYNELEALKKKWIQTLMGKNENLNK